MSNKTIEKHRYFMVLWEPLYKWCFHHHYPQYASFQFVLYAAPPDLARALKDSADRLFLNNFDFDESKYFIALYKKVLRPLSQKVEREFYEGRDRFEKYTQVFNNGAGAGRLGSQGSNSEQEEQQQLRQGGGQDNVLRESSLQPRQEGLFGIP